MPIDRKRYPKDWAEISHRIRFDRAGGRCEWCGAEHGKMHPITGKAVQLHTHHIGVAKPDGSPGDPEDKMDNRDENLLALCRCCHLIADRPLHVKHAKRTRGANKHRRIIAAGQRPLFE